MTYFHCCCSCTEGKEREALVASLVRSMLYGSYNSRILMTVYLDSKKESFGCFPAFETIPFPEYQGNDIETFLVLLPIRPIR